MTMNTDDLISDLGDHPPRKSSLSPNVTMIAAALASLGIALSLSLLWLKPRSDLGIPLIVHNHIFLLKLAFTAGVVAVALPVLRDLSIPGRRLGRASAFIGAPFAVMTALAAFRELAVHHDSEWPLYADHTWLECLWQIPALAAPALIILVFAVRSLAPTNLTRAGAYVGLLAGGIGAVGYAFHCHHDSVVFVGITYTLAIVETVVLGAIIGSWLLRWI